MRNLAKLLVLLGCSNWVVYAEQADFSLYNLTLKELMEVSVITAASGFEQSLNRAPSNATVITREQWQAKGAYTLAQALESVAGLHITDPQVNFIHTVFMIRGLAGTQGEQVKLLIDGQPLEYMQSAGNPLGFNMPINMFERIEVIKGPGSAVYGADAFAGVINLVSSKEKQPAMTAALGNFDTYALSLNNSFKGEEYELYFAMDYVTTNDDPGRRVNSDLQSVLDGILSTNASNAPGAIDEHYDVMSLMGKWRWQDLSLHYHTWRNFDLGIAGGVAQALDNKGSAESHHDRLTLNWDLAGLVGSGKLDASFSYAKQKNISFLYVFPQGAVLPIGADGNVQFSDPVGVTAFPDGLIGTPSNRGRTYTSQLTRLNQYGDHNVRWQLGFEYQDFQVFERKNFGPGVLDGTQSQVDGSLTDVTGTRFIYMPNKSRHFYYVSLLDEWDVSENTILSLGLRHDHYSDFGSTTNPRVSLIHQLQQSLSANFFIGTAFRAPSYADLYMRNNPVVLGNPDLKPEGIRTAEIGLGFDYWVNDNFLLSVDLFDYDADDLIDLVYDPELNYEVSQNVGVQKGQGGELSINWKPQKDMSINFNYAYIHSVDGQGREIAGVPATMWYLDFHYRFESQWRIFLDAKWIKDRQRYSSDLREPLKDYYRVNSNISYTGLMPGVTLSLTMRNLFDHDAREPSDGSIAEDYPQPGRHWMFTVDYQF